MAVSKKRQKPERRATKPSRLPSHTLSAPSDSRVESLRCWAIGLWVACAIVFVPLCLNIACRLLGLAHKHLPMWTDFIPALFGVPAMVCTWTMWRWRDQQDKNRSPGDR